MSYCEYVPTIERVIIDGLIDRILAKGYMISVNDGEETVISRATDKKAIQKAIGHTGETHFIVRNAEGKKLGWILLIHGNEEDVVADLSVSLEEVV